MASLSSELEAVTDALSSSIDPSIQSLSTSYYQKIQRNVETRDSAGRDARDASLNDRAIKSTSRWRNMSLLSLEVELLVSVLEGLITGGLSPLLHSSSSWDNISGQIWGARS
jgi:hypothetical protein